MVSFTLLTLSLLHGAALAELFTGFDPAPSVAPVLERPQAPQEPRGLVKCNANNCLNVMTNTPSAASSFCSTFLAATTVVTVTPTVTVISSSTILPSIPTITASASLDVPAHISSQCVLTTATPLASRLSSACSCLSVVPASTVTSTAYAPAATIINPCDTLPSPYTVGGATFNLHCGTYIFGRLINEYDGTLPDMQSCMAVCANIQGCIAIDWADAIIDEGETGCALLSEIVDEGFAVYDFAILNNQTLPDDFWESIVPYPYA